MFKFELGQTVWYLVNNRAHSAQVWSRMCVQNAHDDWASTQVQRDTWQHFGASGIKYVTCHGVVDQSDVYDSRDSLADAIREGVI